MLLCYFCQNTGKMTLGPGSVFHHNKATFGGVIGSGDFELGATGVKTSVR